MRLPDDLRHALDDYRREQSDLPSRSEAIRRILRAALKVRKN
jgi:metal-responsive CopG/Arc/MetJ family transcriptional regulator